MGAHNTAALCCLLALAIFCSGVQRLAAEPRTSTPQHNRMPLVASLSRESVSSANGCTKASSIHGANRMSHHCTALGCQHITSHKSNNCHVRHSNAPTPLRLAHLWLAQPGDLLQPGKTYYAHHAQSFAVVWPVQQCHRVCWCRSVSKHGAPEAAAGRSGSIGP